MKRNFKRALVLGLFLILLFSFFLFLKFSFWSGETSLEEQAVFNASSKTNLADGLQEKPSESILAASFFSVLDGSNIFEKESSVFAAVIENHPQARPQQMGLPEASIVYEALAEGGITRFLAIYSHNKPEMAGPIRSARPYFVDLASQFYALFLHAGGSEDGLAAIQNNDNVLGFDGLVYEGINYFVRSKKYKAPHNLFVIFKDIEKALPHLKWKFHLAESFLPFKQEDDFSHDETEIKRLTIHFSFPEFDVSYRYNSSKGRYERFMASKLHDMVEPANIGIIFTDIRAYDDDGRLNIKTTGKGNFWLFRDGKLWKGQWKRSDHEMMQFLDMEGNKLYFKPGQTFFELMNDVKKVDLE